MAVGESSLAKVGRWLSDEVGEDSIFTKQQLREALPEYEQADRRMRDLRAYGWRIDTNRQDASLKANELRLVTIGARVWVPGIRNATTPRVTAAERLASISAADFRCQSCGIQAGAQLYPEERFARLEVLKSSAGLLVACTSCSKGASALASSGADRLQDLLAGLTNTELARFRSRVEARDFFSPLEAALALASRLPADSTLQAADDALQATR